MEFKKYILKKFDYNVNVSNKKFYTPDETIKQKLGINVKFLKDRKNIASLIMNSNPFTLVHQYLI